MACSLASTGSDGTIVASEMRDGEMGVVQVWPGNPRLIGNVVQRYRDALILLGTRSGDCFGTSCGGTGCSARIRLLSPGDMIRIDSFETA